MFPPLSLLFIFQNIFCWGNGGELELEYPLLLQFLVNIFDDLNLNVRKLKVVLADMVAKVLYDVVRGSLPEYVSSSFEQFRAAVSLSEVEIVGALFSTINYQIVAHVDKDASLWSFGLVLQNDDVVKEGDFFYADYGAKLTLKHNMVSVVSHCGVR